MGNIWVRASCGFQLWLINHPNCITNIILHWLYAIDVLTYSISGPLNFLTRREKIYGPNYAALGRVIVGEYSKCADIISMAQKRGSFLGRAKLYPKRLPDNFILFLSDAEAGGDDRHAILHNYIWETLVPPAFARLEDSVFQTYVQDAVAQIKNGVDKKQTIQNMVLNYVFHSIIGQPLTPSQLATASSFVYGNSPFSSLTNGAVKPFAGLLGCCQGKRSRDFTILTDVVMNSPALENYVPSNESANLDKRNYAENILCVVSIAGCLGSMNLCMNVVDLIPKDYPINLDDKKEVTLAILEAARIKAPVNNVNVILQNDFVVTIKGRSYSLPKGTIVAGSIGLASVDPVQFPNPSKFDPKRDNLMSSTLNFNHVGFSPIGSGQRQCPGRNIAVKLASDLLIELRKSYAPPYQS